MGSDIIFLNGCPEGQSPRYRIHNLIEGLAGRGYTAEAIDFCSCRQIVHRELAPKIAVLFRAPFDPTGTIVEVLEYFSANGVRTVFDIDDYVFGPSIVSEIAGVVHFDERQLRQYEWGVRGYRSMIFRCDRTTTTTRFLAERMRGLGRDAYIVPNSVNAGQRNVAAELLRWPKPNDGHVRICYFSGSATHQRDFLEAEAAIQDVLRLHSHVVLRVIGLLHLGDSWRQFDDRVERLGFMPELDMIEALYECDINIAPLEEGNIFCEGKSELKFFEAALVCVPTIASRTVTYVEAIEDAVTGLLASGRAEWKHKLEMLILSCETREQMGVEARTIALTRFDADAAARHALAAYGLAPFPGGDPVAKDSPFIP